MDPLKSTEKHQRCFGPSEEQKRLEELFTDDIKDDLVPQEAFQVAT